MALLEVKGIWFRENRQEVLKDISFTQTQGRKLALAGETGSGKSTLLQVIAGLVQPGEGLVLFDKQKVKGPAEVLVPGHPGIAYLSQQYELPQFLRVEQVLRYANTLEPEDAAALFELCHISHLLERSTSQLSGGERQRIALARLLLGGPRLLLLDEPYSNLDRAHKNLLQGVIRDLSQELGITCLLVSHDPQDTLSWADEILVLQNGALLQQGSPEQVYRQPRNTYAAGLFGSYNLVSGEAASLIAQALDLSQVPGKSLLIRPENLHLATGAEPAFAARLEAKRFFGAYYELDVAVAGQQLTFRTAFFDLPPGKDLALTLDPGSASYV
ncbi:MAG: ABC transporter ATP-binding protein [Adhaeribacter sp.]